MQLVYDIQWTTICDTNNNQCVVSVLSYQFYLSSLTDMMLGKKVYHNIRRLINNLIVLY